MASPTLGIRKEDKSRWERRVPLSPMHVAELVKQGISVLVQPSSLRVFSDEEYQKVGAVLSKDLSGSDVIIGVKEVPADKLLPNVTYMFFSHTIKAQAGNMAMLDTILERNIRLIDYEKIVDATSGQRLVRFGKFAGMAGFIDMVRALGDRLLAVGFSTPFLHVGYTHMYAMLQAAANALARLGQEIRDVGLPAELCPFVLAVSGADGSVASGVLELLEQWPCEYVTVDQLPNLMAAPDTQRYRNTIYVVRCSTADVVQRRDGGAFSRDHYRLHPDEYAGTFHTRVAPYMSVLFNCTYWDSRFPRLLTTAQMNELRAAHTFRLVAVADISCDENGSVEFFQHTSSIDQPVYMYDPDTGSCHAGVFGKGILFLGVDNLPTELPREASIFFGDALLPFIAQVVRSDRNLAFEQMLDLPPEVRSAVITAGGRLTPPFAYIQELRHARDKLRRRVLVLGSGFVALSVVDYLLRSSANYVSLATNVLSQADALRDQCKVPERVSTHELDVALHADLLAKLVASHQVVVSVVPAFLHPIVARVCIKHGVHMVTASYLSDELRAMQQQAADAGVLLLNEVGLDPGIDHISALTTIHDIQESGGKIVGFESLCGGLPAPEAANNPLGYKFSWNPRGVLTALLNKAQFIQDGKVVTVEGESVFASVRRQVIEPCFYLEVLPNRDSTIYQQLYGLHDLQNLFRGTLRYKGYSRIVHAFYKLGLLDDKPDARLASDAPALVWRDLMLQLLEGSDPSVAASSAAAAVDEKSLQQQLLLKLGLSADAHNDDAKQVADGLKWLGLFADVPVLRMGNKLDSLCARLQQCLRFEERERDLVVLTHRFDIQWPTKMEKRTSTLIAFGEPGGPSAMCFTVGTPCGIAAQCILDGTFGEQSGVMGPFKKEIFQPLMAKLADEGISFFESSSFLPLP